MFRRIITAAMLLAASSAVADAKLEYVDEQTGEVSTTIYIKGDRMRLDDTAGGGYTLFDGAKQEILFVDDKERTITRMDEAAMEEAATEVSSAMAELKRELEKMPPEQREMMERMMGGVKDMGKSMFEVKVERSGKRMNKGGYSCEHVVYSVGRVASTEMCVVEEGKLSLSRQDRATMQAMNRQMQQFAEKMSQGIGMDFSFDPSVLGGFPVWMKDSDSEHGEVLRHDAKASIDASLFTVPKDYREEKLGGN